MNGVAYTRYSPGRKQSDMSTEGQLRACYDYCEKNGITIIKEYNDRKITGRVDTRPEFQRLITEAAAGGFTHVIVWQFDRFARNRFDSAIYKAALRKHGIKVVSATEPISDSPEGIILEGVLEAMAEYYSANLSRVVKRGHMENALQGIYVGGTVPTGYKLDKKMVAGKVVESKLVIDEDKAHIVRFVFESYAAGVGKKEIADTLNNNGYKTALGNPFTIHSFYAMLKNKKYIGEYVYDGEEVKGGCPALIDIETYNTAQVMLRANKQKAGSATARVDYLLQGKAYCGICGSRLQGDMGTGRGGVRHHYYSCGNRKRGDGCKKATEKKGFLEWYVVEQTCLWVLNPERIDKIAADVVKAYNKDYSRSSVKEFEKRVEKLNRDIDKAVDASIEAPTGARQKYFDKIIMLEAQRADAESYVSQLRVAEGAKLTTAKVKAWLMQFCKGDPLDEAFQKRVIDMFINSVFVYDDLFLIYYNAKGGEQRLIVDPPPDADIAEAVEAARGSSIEAQSPPNRVINKTKFVYYPFLFLITANH